jgi:hypothetical protein
MILNIQKITQNTFRYLVVFVFVSIGYDILWFYLKYSEYYADDTITDGGTEKGIRKFSLSASLLLLIFKLLMALVFWKDSLDYENIMQGRDKYSGGDSPKTSVK